MHFLKTLFWVVIAIGVVLFARENWVPVEIQLWSGLIAEVKLPFLLLVVFLLGFVPTYLLYRARTWTLRRQIGRPDRVVVGNQPISNTPPTADASAPATEPAPMLTKEPSATERPAGSLL